MKKTMTLALVLVAFAACKRAEQKATTQTATTTSTAQARGTDTAATSTPATASEPGAMMPEYAAMQLDGSKFDLASKKEKVVLLNVWATWCGPCRFEIPELQKLHEEYAARGFEVIGVSVDESGVESVRDFIQEQKKMTYPVVVDAEGKITNLLETSVLPTSVLLDRTGKIIWKKYGAIMEGDQELKQAIEKTL